MQKGIGRTYSIFRSVRIGCGPKVFCISMQRTGTTSVGKFFRDFGFRWSGWPSDRKNDWSGSWYDGDYEKIFTSRDFRRSNAYEDSPWFMPDFYKILYHRFPGSKFILFLRNPDSWFKSMLKHSNGNIIGASRVHCKIYRRELEYLCLLKKGQIDEKMENSLEMNKTLKLIGLEEHYKEIYRLHNEEVVDFFSRHAPDALHVGQLEDPDKWNKLGAFLGVQVPAGYESHENYSKS